MYSIWVFAAMFLLRLVLPLAVTLLLGSLLKRGGLAA